jgi:hypothetical protein
MPRGLKLEIETEQIEITLEGSTAIKALGKDRCPNCHSRLEWEHRAWDLDQQHHLVLFGYYVCSACDWRSSLKTRKFRFPDQKTRFGTEKL